MSYPLTWIFNPCASSMEKKILCSKYFCTWKKKKVSNAKKWKNEENKLSCWRNITLTLFCVKMKMAILLSFLEKKETVFGTKFFFWWKRRFMGQTFYNFVSTYFVLHVQTQLMSDMFEYNYNYCSVFEDPIYEISIKDINWISLAAKCFITTLIVFA